MPSLLIFFLIAWAVLFSGQMLEGGHAGSLFSHPAPLLLVFGITLSVSAAAQSFGELGQVGKATIKAFFPKKIPAATATITMLAEMADVAARGGLIALEGKLSQVEDPFTRRGLELVIDGTDSERVADVLHGEIDALEKRHKVGAGYWTSAGGYAPTIGILGTVMSLVHVLENLGDPASLGASIAAAFLATFWGVASANLIFLPIATRLKRLTAVEVAHRDLVVDGILDIQAGNTGRLVIEHLKSTLPTSKREELT